jgi:hypothetical protein
MPLSTLCRAAMVGLRAVPKPRYVFICVADHFEPDWRGAERSRQVDRVQRWVNDYGRLFSEFEDSRGRAPQHTFFYPIEVYDEQHIERLCTLVRQGLGDIEIHLHHDNDSSARLTELLEHYRVLLHERHGLLSKDALGQIQYGFIHGNWSLDNSHPEGKWCGVNDELTVLVRTGCYADFTMPAAPHASQTTTINQIYYAVDDPEKPKSHNVGVSAKVGSLPPQGSLLLVQGPLLLSCTRGSLVPRIRLENGNLARNQPPTFDRVRSWLRAGVSVAGRPDWLFIKLHTHGAQEDNMKVVLDEPMRQLHRDIHSLSKSNGFQYFYVTARELAQLVHQAESDVESVDFDSLSW